jgi:hypothetical protein
VGVLRRAYERNYIGKLLVKAGDSRWGYWGESTRGSYIVKIWRRLEIAVGILGLAYQKRHSGNAEDCWRQHWGHWGESTRGSYLVERKAGDGSGGNGANIREEATQWKVWGRLEIAVGVRVSVREEAT